MARRAIRRSGQTLTTTDCARLRLALGHGLDVDGEIAEFRRVLGQADMRRVLSRSAYADLRQLDLAHDVPN